MPLGAAVVRVDADRDRRALAERRAGVDAEARDEQRRLRAEVRGREAERAAAGLARDDRALDLDRAAEQRRRAAHVAGGDEPPDRASRRRPRRAARRASRCRAARAARGRRCGARPKRNSAPATTTSAPIAARYDSTNSSGASAAISGVNSTTSVSSTPSSASSSSRRSSVESSDTWLPSTSRGCGWKVTTVGMRPGLDRGAHDRAVAEVDAVERADRDRARPPLELAGRRARPSRRDRLERRARASRIASGTRATASAGRRASASDAGMQPLRVGLLDAERPDRRAPQRPAVPAERLRERAHVRPRADVQPRA